MISTGMFIRIIKIVAALILVSILLRILLVFAVAWPAFQTLHEVSDNSKVSFEVLVTFNKNKPSYEYLKNTQGLVNPFPDQIDTLYIPINTRIRLFATSEDRVYKFVAKENGINFDIVPGYTTEQVIDPLNAGEHTLAYEITTDEGSWPLHIKFIALDKFMSEKNSIQ